MKNKLLPPATAWPLITEMGWGSCWNTKPNSTEIARTWFKKLGELNMKLLEAFVNARANDLYQAVEEYEATHGSLEVGSDDSFSDLRYHIVGLGQVQFERHLANPMLIAERYAKGEYEESFAYCFQEPDPLPTVADLEAREKAILNSILEMEKAVGPLVESLHQLQFQLRDARAQIAILREGRERLAKETA
jgi:hypothetical protein